MNERPPPTRADELAEFIERLRMTGVRAYKGPAPGSGAPLDITFERPNTEHHQRRRDE